MPQPDAGQQFCLAKFSVTNEADGNHAWSANEATWINVGMAAEPAGYLR